MIYESRFPSTYQSREIVSILRANAFHFFMVLWSGSNKVFLSLLTSAVVGLAGLPLIFWGHQALAVKATIQIKSAYRLKILSFREVTEGPARDPSNSPSGMPPSQNEAASLVSCKTTNEEVPEEKSDPTALDGSQLKMVDVTVAPASGHFSLLATLYSEAKGRDEEPPLSKALEEFRGDRTEFDPRWMAMWRVKVGEDPTADEVLYFAQPIFLPTPDGGMAFVRYQGVPGQYYLGGLANAQQEVAQQFIATNLPAFKRSQKLNFEFLKSNIVSKCVEGQREFWVTVGFKVELKSDLYKNLEDAGVNVLPFFTDPQSRAI